MPLGVQVEELAGAGIEDTAAEMLQLANRMQVRVLCDFNSVKLSMPPNGCVETLVSEFWVAVKRPEGSLKMAFG